MIRNSTTLIAIAVSGLLGSTPALAQPQQQGPWVFTLDAAGAHQSETDLKDFNGGFSIDQWFVSAGVDYGWSRRDSVGLSVGGGKSNYEFNELSEFGGGQPWESIEDFRVALNGRFGFGDTGSIFIIPTLRYNGEKGASKSDSRTWGLLSAITWRLNENLTIGPGFGVFGKLEDGTRFFPILAIDWNINDRWNLSTGRGLAASRGPGLTLSYKLNDDWSLGLAGRYEDQEFRLDDKGVAPGGVGRDQSVPLVFNASLTPSRNLNLNVFAGIEFAGKLKLKNADDVIVDESKYDPAPIFGATFQYRF